MKIILRIIQPTTPNGTISVISRIKHMNTKHKTHIQHSNTTTKHTQKQTTQQHRYWLQLYYHDINNNSKHDQTRAHT